MHPYTAAIQRQRPQTRQIGGLIAATRGGKTAEGAGVGAVVGAIGGAAVGSATGKTPMGVGIGLATGAALGALLGYLAGAPAAAAAPTPTSQSTAETLAVGAMSAVSLSLSTNNNIVFSAPGSGTILGITSSNPSVIASNSSLFASTATATAAAQGSTTLTISWNDGSNNQTSTLAVTVGA